MTNRNALSRNPAFPIGQTILNLKRPSTIFTVTYSNFIPRYYVLWIDNYSKYFKNYNLNISTPGFKTTNWTALGCIQVQIPFQIFKPFQYDSVLKTKINDIYNIMEQKKLESNHLIEQIEQLKFIISQEYEEKQKLIFNFHEEKETLKLL